MANEKRLIKMCDATAVYNGIALHMAENAYLNDTALDVLKMVAGWLNDAPAVDAVEVVHGHWYEHYGITICSHCQAMFDTDLKMLQVPSTWEMPNYCPNCGAKMDGGNEDV